MVSLQLGKYIRRLIFTICVDVNLLTKYSGLEHNIEH